MMASVICFGIISRTFHLEGASILWTISQQLDDLWQEVCKGSNCSWKMESVDDAVRLEKKYIRIY